MPSPTAFALVTVGSACGGALRFAMATWLDGRWLGFPLGTLLINALGCLIIGWVGAAYGARDEVRWFVMTGLLGGFTTFSAFSWQTLEFMRAERMGAALAYVALSLGLCFLGVWLGWLLGR